MNTPLHERIRLDFETRILSGALAPGARLPTEQELMELYRCARMTVNKALSALATAGLVDRRKKAGTFVARPRVHSMAMDIPDLGAQVAERGQAYRFDLSLRREMRATQARLEWKVDISVPLLELEGIHFADGAPFALEHRFVNVAAVSEILDADFTGSSPGTWLLEHVPWTEADARITATGASAAEARLLAVEPGAPCLCVERKTWRGLEPITYVRQQFVAGAYELTAHFGPGASARREA
ncbi:MULTISPECIES: UTRA domain-containing protein [Novosphingobium]|uniref:UTRA domain-containing protein n=2 Tax=Novosphingobium sp. ST904 TaxID=1684385 RepID=UPI00104FA1DA|nr:UTRA domain-containing protein [Novosphingobium sp. ST904]TCM37158.1 GntR family transcriptional regulator [Novosphingobium sp. ST904]